MFINRTSPDNFFSNNNKLFTSFKLRKKHTKEIIFHIRMKKVSLFEANQENSFYLKNSEFLEEILMKIFI